MAFCYECGTKLNDNAKFCHGCGIEIKLPTTEKGNDAPVVEERKKKITYAEEKVDTPKPEKTSKYKEVTKEQVTKTSEPKAEEIKKKEATPSAKNDYEDDLKDTVDIEEDEDDDDYDEENSVTLLPDDEDDDDEEDEDDYEDDDDYDEENLQDIPYAENANASNPKTDPYWNDIIPEVEDELSKIPKDLVFKGIGAVLALVAVMAWLIYMLA